MKLFAIIFRWIPYNWLRPSIIKIPMSEPKKIIFSSSLLGLTSVKTQSAITCSKLIIETLEQVVQYVQS